jgi:site-specific DNA recombinase
MTTLPFSSGKRDTAVLYARCASQEQGLIPFRLAGKLAACRVFAKEEGYKIIAEYTDVGRSGRDMDRPGLQAALSLVKDGRAQVLMCHAPTDLVRGADNAIALLHQVSAWGGRVVVSGVAYE